MTAAHYIEYRFMTRADRGARWRVRAVSLDEQIGAPYVARIALFTQHGDDPAALLGSSCSLTLARRGSEHCVHGIVSRVEYGEATPSTRAVQVTLVPALQALAQRTTHRIFTDKTVPEVLDRVLGPALADYGRTHLFDLRRSTYPRREYVVQHGESDLCFVRRLMHDEGMWLFFEQSTAADAERVVVVDTNQGARDAALGACGNVPALALDGRIAHGEEAITHFARALALTPTGVRVRALDWTHPEVPQDERRGGMDTERVRYETEGVTRWGYERASYTRFDTDEQARLRWEQASVDAVRVQGRSNLVGLRAGMRMRLEAHPHEPTSDWLVLSVEGASTGGDEREGAADFLNRFVCIPDEVPYRPARLPKPRVHGIQTAFVVGADGRREVAPEGDDIHTDEHGRVRAKFPWDLTEPGSADATVTCWLRVAQTWAGAGWGALFIPRVGTEVIVSFVDGDPDQPLVTGCVYNGSQRPLLDDVAADKTKSYLKSRSSPGHQGSNELRFDDARGREEVYLHAQRDHHEHVEREQTRTVGSDQRVRVGGDQRLEVRGQRVKDVGGDDARGEVSTIRGTRELTVTDKSIERLEDTRLLDVARDAEETYGQRRIVRVMGDDRCAVQQGNKHVDVHMGSYEVRSLCRLSLTQAATTSLTLCAGAELRTEGSFMISNPGVSIVADRDGKLTIMAKNTVVIGAGTAPESAKDTTNPKAKLTLSSDGTIALTGTKVTVGVANNTTTYEAAGVTTKAVKIETTAVGMHEIQGAMIKLG